MPSQYLLPFPSIGLGIKNFFVRFFSYVEDTVFLVTFKVQVLKILNIDYLVE